MSEYRAIQRKTTGSAKPGNNTACLTWRLRLVLTLFLLASLGSTAHSSDEPNAIPLLDTARTLHCTANQNEANAALSQLKSNIIAEVKMPNQWFGRERNPEIHAATFDIVIKVILDSIERFPDSIDLAESVLLGWNYCAVHHSGKYFDLSIDNGKVNRKQADESAPVQWTGFERLGVSSKGQQRYIPKSFSRTQKSIRQQVVYDWWAIQRNQCLPHPGTGELYYQKTLFGPSKVSSKETEKNAEYPFAWVDDCAMPYTKEEHQAYALKLAKEKAEQDRIDKEQTELALALAREKERQRAAEQARQNEAQQRLLREQLVLQKAQRIQEQQRQKEAQALLAIKTQREEARAALRERARAYALRQKLEKEAADLEAAAMEKAEREFAMQRPNPEPPVAMTKPDLKKPATANPATQQLSLKQQSLSEPQAVEAPTGEKHSSITYAESDVTADQNPVREKSTQPKTVTYSTQSNLPAAVPEVFIKEEPTMASAIGWSEQTTVQNLQSTAPQSTSAAFPSSSIPPFDEKGSKFKDRKYHGFSGSFALSNKGLDSDTDAWSLTANFAYKPIRSSYFFARSGFTWKADGEEPTYYWGIGYNDWHTGTWAFELNHWGPLKPGDGLELEKAVASLSYKFDSPLLKKYGLSSSFTLSGGENAAPTTTLAGSWTPKPNWFVRTLITQPLEGGDTTWAYGFGYSDWRTKTWALEYNNWGTNKAFDLNFRENALVTLSWKWGF